MDQVKEVEVLVLSDIHLGTPGSQVQNLVHYLKKVNPQQIILNGDIFDLWHYDSKHWNTHCLEFLNIILKWDKQGKKIVYLTGNHDEYFRKFAPLHINNILLENKHILHLDNKKYWCFHGDVFDVAMKYSKWIVRLGSWTYDLLIKINLMLNTISKWMGGKPFSLAQKVKYKFKSAVTFIYKFEENIVNIAADNNYDGVIVGHIHIPQIRTHCVNNKEILYLNSGDWVENGTALEYAHNEWKIYYFHHK